MYMDKQAAIVYSAVMGCGVLYQDIFGISVAWWEGDTKFTRLLLWDSDGKGGWVAAKSYDVVEYDDPTDVSEDMIIDDNDPTISIHDMDDNVIRRVATAFDHEMTSQDVRAMLQCEGFSEDEAFLYYMAGKILHEDRMSDSEPMYFPKADKEISNV